MAVIKTTLEYFIDPFAGQRAKAPETVKEVKVEDGARVNYLGRQMFTHQRDALEQIAEQYKLRPEELYAPQPNLEVEDGLVTKLRLDYQTNSSGSLKMPKEFYWLKELYCHYNKLTALDVTGLSALQGLYCHYNKLTALDVTGLSALRWLGCSNNNLTALDVSGLSALQLLYCSDNSLTALDVSGLSALQELWCSYNKLTVLDVAGLSALQGLYCYNNNLTVLDVSGLSALQQLYCSGNNLTALDVSGLSALQGLYCDSKALSPKSRAELKKRGVDPLF